MRAAALLLLAALPGLAGADAARSVARRVQSLYERTRDLEADFVQTYTYAGGRRLVSRGRVRLKKPGMMRWDYREPEAKTVAVKGSRLVQWEPEANQAYVDDAFDATALSAAVAFLLGKGDLEREFEISAGDGGTLLLRPRKPDPRVASIALTVDEAGQVTASVVVDGSGNANRMAFENVRRNVGLSDRDFDVAVPAGARRAGPPRP